VLRLAAGINRTDRKEGREGDNASDKESDRESDVEGEQDKGEKDKKKKVSAKRAAAAAAAAAAGTAHLEENADKLNLTKLDLTFDVDPLFHRTSAKVWCSARRHSRRDEASRAFGRGLAARGSPPAVHADAVP
jgi:hypothetical protein